MGYGDAAWLKKGDGTNLCSTYDWSCSGTVTVTLENGDYIYANSTKGDAGGANISATVEYYYF